MGILNTTFSSLRHKNFRYWWLGQCISLMGTWMQRSAQIWLVYTLTKSPALLGLLAVFQSGPILLLSMPAGVYADRVPKRKLVMVTQTAMAVQAFLMAALVWTGHAQYWNIAALAVLLGISTAFDNPARQSFYVDLVGKDDLMNAISLNSTIVNLAKIVGPSLGGVLMVVVGPALCFLLNGLSFLAVLFSLFKIDIDGLPKKTQKVRGNMVAESKLGLAYIMKNDTLRLTAAICLFVCIFAFNSNVVIPVFTDTVLGKGVHEYSLLMSINGFGAMIGALAMATRSKRGLNGKVLVLDSILICLVQLSISFSKNIWTVGALIALLGGLNMTFMNMANSTMQLSCSDEYRGRVMAFYMLINNGATPLGNSFAGGVMEKFGGAAGYGVGGGLTLVLILALFITQRRGFQESLMSSPRQPVRSEI